MLQLVEPPNNRPELILHIGMPKTGTTSIQEILGRRRGALLDQNVFFPRSPGGTNHALLAAAVLTEDHWARNFFPTMWEGMAPAARIARFHREFAAEFAAIPAHVTRVILSAEHCGMFVNTPERVAALAALLRPHAGRIRIVAYLRRQDLYEASLYNERLRSGQLMEPRLPEPGAPMMQAHDYATILNAWADVFGDDAIIVRIFDRATLLEGDVIEDFFAICGIALDIGKNDPLRKSNASLSRRAQSLMLRLGRRLETVRGTGAVRTSNWQRIGTILSTALPGAGWRPPAEEARAFLARFEAGNEAVRRRFRPDLPALFAPPEDAIQEQPEPAEAQLLTAMFDSMIWEVESESAQIANLWLQKSRLHRRLGEAREARLALQHAIWRNPNHIEARLDMAEEFLRDGDPAAALEHARAAERIAPRQPRVQDALRRIVAAQQTPPPLAGAA